MGHFCGPSPAVLHYNTENCPLTACHSILGQPCMPMLEENKMEAATNGINFTVAVNPMSGSKQLDE